MKHFVDPRLRFRVWIAARLADEAWIDASNPDAEQLMEAVRAHQYALVEQAAAADRPWLIEVYDPAKPEDEAYWRLGTDAAGMVDPIPFSNQKD